MKKTLFGAALVLASLTPSALGNGAPWPRPTPPVTQPTPPATQTQPASQPNKGSAGMIVLGLGLAAIFVSSGVYLLRRRR